MQQPDECPPKGEIEMANGNQRHGIVKHSARGFFDEPALLHQTLFDQIAETSALLRGFQYTIEWLATFQRCRFHFAQHGRENCRDVCKFHSRADQLLRSAKNEILHNEEINLVSIRNFFLRIQ